MSIATPVRRWLCLRVKLGRLVAPDLAGFPIPANPPDLLEYVDLALRGGFRSQQQVFCARAGAVSTDCSAADDLVAFTIAEWIPGRYSDVDTM